MKKNKEKVMLFFCDIAGTFDSDLSKSTTERYYNEFKYILEEKRKILGADKVLFSFVTADDREKFLLIYIDVLKEYILSDKIALGRQFLATEEIVFKEDGAFKNFNSVILGNKIDKVAEYVNRIKKDYDILNVTIADDFANEFWLEKLKSGIADPDIKTDLLIPYYPKTNIENVYCSEDKQIKGLVDCLKASIKKISSFSDADEREINKIANLKGF